VRSGWSTAAGPPTCNEVEYDRHHLQAAVALHPTVKLLVLLPVEAEQGHHCGHAVELELALARPGEMPGAQGARRTRTPTGRADLEGAATMA
jgi:hypothetical protein